MGFLDIFRSNDGDCYFRCPEGAFRFELRTVRDPNDCTLSQQSAIEYRFSVEATARSKSSHFYIHADPEPGIEVVGDQWERDLFVDAHSNSVNFELRATGEVTGTADVTFTAYMCRYQLQNDVPNEEIPTAAQPDAVKLISFSPTFTIQ